MIKIDNNINNQNNINNSAYLLANLNIKAKPNDIPFSRYAIMNTLDHAESEDLAARLVEAGLKNDNSWVGMSYANLRRQVADNIKSTFGECKSNNKIISTLTFAVMTGGIKRLDKEIIRMVDEGYINIKKIYIEGKCYDYLMPTQKLIETIISRKGIKS